MCPTAFPDENGVFDLRFYKRNPKKISDTRNSEVFIVHKEGSPDLVAKFFLNTDTDIDILGLMKLKHKNLVEYKGYFWKRYMHYDKKKTVIPQQLERALVMEYCTGGDLRSVINSSKKSDFILSKDVFLSYSHQIASGIDYLHEHGIIHRDLKTQNIFITGRNKEIAKVGDYEDYFIMLNGNKKECGGTDFWKPPEFSQGDVGVPSDTFSFGLILWSMVKRKEPTRIEPDMTAFNMEITSKSTNISDLVDKVLTPLLLFNPKNRRLIKGFLSSFCECKEVVGNLSDDDWDSLWLPQ